MMRFRLIGVFCLFAATLLAAEIVGGPYVVNVTARGATVAWIVQSGDVALGPEAGEWTKKAPALRVEKASFTGLEAGKTYHYDVLGREEGRGWFKTPPAGESKFQFVVFGDTRTRHELHQKIIDAIVKTAPDFVIHTGDLVQDGADSAQWPAFFRIERELLRRTAFFPSLGNHERNSPQYHQYFDVASPYYTFTWGAARFIVLNSDYGNAAATAAGKNAFWEQQTRWLEETLEGSGKAALRFVVFHNPPYTAVARRQQGEARTQEWVPLFEKHKVHAVFNGHDHNYQHHLKNGVHYVVTGGGGAPLYPVDAPMKDLTRKVESVEHYVRVRVEGRRATAEAVAIDGRLLDTIEFP